MEQAAEQVQKRGRGRPMIRTPEEAAERRRAQTRARVQALRQRQKDEADRQAVAEQEAAGEALRRRVEELERENAGLRAELASARSELDRLRTPAPPSQPWRTQSRTESVHDIAASRLRSFVDRIERLRKERKKLRGISSDAAKTERSLIDADIKRVHADALHQGFDPTLIEQAIKLRAIPAAIRRERDFILKLYMEALD